MSMMTAWSYSRYAAYEQCPLQCKLRFLDKIGTVTSEAMERGAEVHRQLAAYIMGGPVELPTVHPKVRYIYDEMRAFSDDHKIVEQQWGFTRNWTPTGWFAKDTYTRVVLDVAMLYEDMSGEAIDHKTGKRYDDSNDDQMELFAVGFMCKYPPATRVTTRLIYVDAGSESFMEFDRAQLPGLIDKWERKIYPMMTDTVFAPKPNHRCRFCPFRKDAGGQCRFG